MLHLYFEGPPKYFMEIHTITKISHQNLTTMIIIFLTNIPTSTNMEDRQNQVISPYLVKRVSHTRIIAINCLDYWYHGPSPSTQKIDKDLSRITPTLSLHLCSQYHLSHSVLQNFLFLWGLKPTLQLKGKLSTKVDYQDEKCNI